MRCLQYWSVFLAVTLTALVGPSVVEVIGTQTAFGYAVEADTVSSVGTTWVEVEFENDDFYAPVGVCSVGYVSTDRPAVVRVKDVSAGGFKVKLQNPGDGYSVGPETVYYLAVEEGVWQLPGGTKVEAQTYTSTVTNQDSSWVGEEQTYDRTYTDPVVVGQVMSANDDTPPADRLLQIRSGVRPRNNREPSASGSPGRNSH